MALSDRVLKFRNSISKIILNCRFWRNKYVPKIYKKNIQTGNITKNIESFCYRFS